MATLEAQAVDFWMRCQETLQNLAFSPEIFFIYITISGIKKIKSIYTCPFKLNISLAIHLYNYKWW